MPSAGQKTGPGFATLVPFAPNLGTQVSSLLQDRAEIDRRALVVVRGGANDMIAQALLEPPEEVFRTPERAVANIADHVRDLAAAGATRFLVSNLGDFDEIPFLRFNGVSDDARRWEDEFNARLPDALHAVREELGAYILLFRADLVSAELRADPASRGLTNLVDPACPGCAWGLPEPDAGSTVAAAPNEFYYWDLVHPTEVVSAAFGEAAADLVRSAIISHRGQPW